MRTTKLLSVTLLAGAIAMTGCNTKKKDELSLLKEENENLRAQLADRNMALDAASAQPLTTMASRPADSDGIRWSSSAGEIRATIDADVLFDSGRTTLKPAAKASLDRVIATLRNQYGGWMIRIEGHTDTDPIKKSGFKSNYHLGFERAMAVREHLISKGVPEKQIALASYGPNLPASTKAQSRRVSIVAVQP
jgi:chemotaxis protein MotB